MEVLRSEGAVPTWWDEPGAHEEGVAGQGQEAGGLG